MKAKDFIIASLIFVIGYIMVFRKQPENKAVDASVIEKEMNEIQHLHEIKMSEAYRKIDSITLVENVYKTQYYEQKRKNRNLEKLLTSRINYNRQYLDSIGANFQHEIRDYRNHLLPTE